MFDQVDSNNKLKSSEARKAPGGCYVRGFGAGPAWRKGQGITSVLGGLQQSMEAMELEPKGSIRTGGR